MKLWNVLFVVGAAVKAGLKFHDLNMCFIFHKWKLIKLVKQYGAYIGPITSRIYKCNKCKEVCDSKIFGFGKFSVLCGHHWELEDFV